MKRSLLAAAAALVLAPSAASAALILNVETITLPASPAQDFNGTIEVFFSETGVSEDEDLTAFNIALDLNSGGTGVAFVPPPVVPTDHQFVFSTVAGAVLNDVGSTTTRVQAFSDIPNASAQNIDDSEGVLRIPVRIPATTPEGTYPIIIDEVNTQFTNPATQTILFAVQNGGVVIGIPEPTTLGLVALGGGLLTLRRRRKA